MTLSVNELAKISQLAYLEQDVAHSPKLIEDINRIMNFVGQLSTVNTEGVTPLFHPLSMTQYLRPDVVTEKTCLTELAALAPKFENELYLVPQVLDASNS